MNDNRISEALTQYLKTSVGVALAEDVGTGDLTAALVPETQRVRARVVTREDCVVCGQPWFDEVFAQTDATVLVHWKVDEGDRAAAGDELCELHGPARAVLTGERTALNFLQLLSATATAARRYVNAVSGTQATVLDTRKTLPGLRLAQKYAVRVGGAENHRIGLYDAILIKENHIAAAGGIGPAVNNAAKQGRKVLVEVEVENLDQLAETLATDAHRVLLDNFSTSGMAKAVMMRNERNANVKLEASGGITLDNIREVAESGIDCISIGALTKDVRAIDLSMRFEMHD